MGKALFGSLSAIVDLAGKSMRTREAHAPMLGQGCLELTGAFRAHRINEKCSFRSVVVERAGLYSRHRTLLYILTADESKTVSFMTSCALFTGRSYFFRCAVLFFWHTTYFVRILRI